MSLPIMHTAVGMSVPFLVGLALFLKRKKLTKNMLIALALAMAVCGLWAQVPDIPRFLPQKYKHLDRDITYSRYGNVFFFHKFLDTHQAEDRGFGEGGALLFAMFFLTLFGAARSVYLNKKEIERLEKAVSGPQKINTEYKDIIDIHCHVIPGVDDGPAGMEESVKMCRRLVEVGIIHAVATPHLPWKGKYETERVVAAYDLLKERIKQENIPLKLSLGADIRISWDMVDKIKEGKTFTLAKSKYFLLELDHLIVPIGLTNFITQCVNEGFYPVLSHPERNKFFQVDYKRLKNLIQEPMLVQVTCSSFAGTQGRQAKKTAIRLLKEGLVDIISSDAHAFDYRLAECKKSLSVVEGIVGTRRLVQMIATAPGMVINNTSIEDIKDLRV